MSEMQLERIGIVDGVTAHRKDGNVSYLVAKLRFETDEKGIYYGDKNRVDNLEVAFPVGSPVNPGDLVELNLRVSSPFGARFAPALEAGSSDE